MIETKFIPTPTFAIQTDGKTVWVHVAPGETVGRFGPRGVDVHNTIEQQLAGEPQCRACTHRQPTATDWESFVAGMAEHGATVGRAFRPAWVKD